MGRTLWLIGMMGSGKTTVAPLAAELLEMAWADTDAEIEAAAGQTVAEILSGSMETFRRLEVEAIESHAGSDLVVACGGGAVTMPDVVDRMRQSGIVVWLRARVDSLASRVTGDAALRPLLGADPADDLERILSAREGLYLAAAHVAVDTDGKHPVDVTSEVVKAWKSASSVA